MARTQLFHDWASASLVIRSEALTAEDITHILDIEPTDVAAKGDRMSKRNPKSAVYAMNFWSVDGDLPSTMPLHDHIAALLDRIEPRAEALLTLTAQCELFFHCSVSGEDGRGRCHLAHGLWQRLAQLPAPLALDLYPPAVDAEQEWLDTQGKDVRRSKNVTEADAALLRKWTAGLLTIRSQIYSADEIARILGVAPTGVRVDEVAPVTDMSRAGGTRTTVWQQESGVPATVPLEAHAVALLDQVEGLMAVLNEPAAQCDLHLSLGFAAENGQGGAWLDRAMIQRVARLPLGVTIHLYPPSVDIRRALSEETD